MGDDAKPPSDSKSIEIWQRKVAELDKLAMIGTLSAGIAHELKNPLNFINNFAELTIELLNDLNAEVIKKCGEDAPEINVLLLDAQENLKKIIEHGKRADFIIKNMLLQARANVTDKTPQNINQLLEEYLNLAYHGMRARDNKLNIKIEKNLDPALPLVNINPQSMGRAILNIINNGLYAANDKASRVAPPFMPCISVATQQQAQTITVIIKDNGTGIPPELQKKIFEPYFTTKDAEHGTGLGLPICYDIVVNEHQGKIEINSKPGEFTEFIITLPIGKKK